MTRRLCLAAVLTLGSLDALWVRAEETRVSFPDLDRLIHYTTVTRGDVTEHILTTPEALQAAREGRPLPDGTQVVLVDIRDDTVYRYFVMQKGAGWGADYDEDRRTGDWQFQYFWGDRSLNLAESTARCQSCHQSRAETEYLYTYNDLRRFAP